MRLATIKTNGQEKAAIVTKNGVVPVEEVNRLFNNEFAVEFFAWKKRLLLCCA